MITETPRSSDSLVDSVGVNTHFHYNNTPYVTNYATVFNLLKGLGVRHIRDTGVVDQFQMYYNDLNQLAAAGIHTDIITQLNQPISQLTAFLALCPNAVEAIEAPNEWDLNGGSTWVADITANQKALYSGVKSTPGLSSLPVYGPSLTSYNSYEALGNLSGFIDQGNMHNYFASANPGNPGSTLFPPGKYNSIQFFMGSAQIVSGTKPVATTETGYEDALSNPTPVTAAVKARYTMRTILEQFNAHVSRTYFYELVDEGGLSYGLVNPSLSPKPVYTALANMLYKLSDGSAPMTFTPLTYSLSADPSVHHTLLQKHDGSYRLLLWVETPATDPVVPTQTVTVTTPTHFGTVAQYAWQDDGSEIPTTLTQTAGGAITLTVTDRVTELKLQK